MASNNYRAGIEKGRAEGIPRAKVREMIVRAVREWASMLNTYDASDCEEPEAIADRLLAEVER